MPRDFEMPGETRGDRWHRMAEAEGLVAPFLVGLLMMVTVCVCVIVVGGSMGPQQADAEEFYSVCEPLYEFVPKKAVEKAKTKKTVKKTETKKEKEVEFYGVVDEAATNGTDVVFSGVDDAGYSVSADVPADEPYAEVEASYRDNGTAESLRYNGVESDGEFTYTWYSENVLDGGGLEIPGRHVDENGYVCDGDGNIAVASSDLEYGTQVETPYGSAVVYDTGCPSGVLDVYTSW